MDDFFQKLCNERHEKLNKEIDNIWKVIHEIRSNVEEIKVSVASIKVRIAVYTSLGIFIGSTLTSGVLLLLQYYLKGGN